MRVLHIVHWYPNDRSSIEGVFIKRHIDALGPHIEQDVWHVQASYGKGLARLKSPAQRTWALLLPMKFWRGLEWLNSIMLKLMWWSRDRNRRYDLVNVHIAYPLLVRTRSIQRTFKLPIVITEHWSAYHFGFHGNSSGLDRIRNIFKHGIPLITVSRSLLADIEKFSGTKLPNACIIPNVVDTDVFAFAGKGEMTNDIDRPVRAFALSTWRSPKRLDVLVDALLLLEERAFRMNITICGTGPQLAAQKDRAKSLGDHVKVLWADKMAPEEVAHHMQLADLFMHCSDHETFSVVCAEALCTGTPVLASCVGGIPEFVDESNGFLVPNNDPVTWAAVTMSAWDRLSSLDPVAFSAQAHARFGAAAVGALYHQFILKAIDS